MVKRTRDQKAWDALLKKKADNKVNVGWFEESRYPNGEPIAGIAYIQNYGAVINVTDKMRGYLGVRGLHLRKDKHQVVIPPTHFMQKAIGQQKKWRDIAHEIYSLVIFGDMSDEEALKLMGETLRGSILESMIDGHYSPDSAATVFLYRNAYKDQKTTGDIAKRLSHTGQMINALSYKVEKA